MAKTTTPARCRCSIDPDFGRFLPANGHCPVHKTSDTRLELAARSTRHASR